MKILVVSPFLPYPSVPHAGGKLVLHLLETLSRAHSVHLVTRYFPGESGHLDSMKGRLSGVDAVPSEGPVRAGSLLSLGRTILSYIRLARRADEAAKREAFDLCQVEYTETGVFWTPPRSLPAVLTCHDIIAKPSFRRYASSRGLSKPVRWAEWRLKLLVERHAISKFRRVFTLSEVDREWAERLYPGVPTRALHYPGGLDLSPIPPRKEIPGRILFVGALNRPRNVEGVRFFVGTVWPFVRARAPHAEFWVVGGGASEEFRRELSRDPRVRVTGRVETLAEYYSSASVFVAPVLAGGGIIVKILDAMAAGVPVVTTSYGNEGIRARDGAEIVVADLAETFADAILRLLDDPERRAAIGEAGKSFVERNFSQQSFEETLRSVYAEAALSHGNPERR